MPRTLFQEMSAKMDEVEMFLANPAHTYPRCQVCHNLTHSERVEPVDTGRGHYYDSEFLCSFCKSDRAQQLEKELQESVIGELEHWGIHEVIKSMFGGQP